MKLISAKSIKIIALTSIIFLTCWNGSMVDSNSKDKRPDVNFYGILQDHKSTTKVEDILIGGKYKQIPVYQEVHQVAKSDVKTSVDQSSSKSAEMDPKQNKTLLDLDEVASITLKYPDNPIEHEIKINNTKYVEILVTSINNSTQTYLIESSRDLSCLKIDQGPEQNQKPVLEERKLNMIHVKNLEIKGKKSAQDVNQSKARDDMANTDKVEIALKIENDLDQIEKNVKNLPQHDPSQYEKFKQSIIALLRSLRDQLQKMLHMIKN
ncbi:hypothetical protein A3J41_00780 [candidate division TM6 bacterium RIFCSPHIGHO2_12_FULL_38_8]|nr:MAG: hypothetical protein A3J41_00780 [candidate division TM6 bacterium RIFCSPHIGHO2_12_FULL_38_8]